MCGSRINADISLNIGLDIAGSLFGQALQGCKPRHHHHHHDCHPQPPQCRPQPPHCHPQPMPPYCPPNDCNTNNPAGDYSGEVSVWGDPHVNGSVSNGGNTTTNIHFDTKGGAGETIMLLDSSGRDSLDVEAEFKSWNGSQDVTVVGEEHVYLNGHEIDIKPGEVSIDGRTIQDGTYSCNGNTITKQGNVTTIKTASGETLTVTDRGGYLDSTLKLDHYQGKLGGMLGDAINGQADPNAMHYADGNMHIMDGAGYGGGYGNYGNYGGGWQDTMPTRDLEWVGQMLSWLGQELQRAGCQFSTISRFLNAFA